jgi:hypothetical protein
VAIARAVAGSPAIVPADEPTRNLDQATGAAILGLLEDLNSQGSTIIVVTHDQGELAQAARLGELWLSSSLSAPGPQSWLAWGVDQLPEAATVSRQRKSRSSPRTRRPVPEPAVDEAHPIWADVCGRRMFVVGFTPAGVSYGIFEDEMDAGTDDLDMGDADQLF